MPRKTAISTPKVLLSSSSTQTTPPKQPKKARRTRMSANLRQVLPEPSDDAFGWYRHICTHPDTTEATPCRRKRCGQHARCRGCQADGSGGPASRAGGGGDDHERSKDGERRWTCCKDERRNKMSSRACFACSHERCSDCVVDSGEPTQWKALSVFCTVGCEGRIEGAGRLWHGESDC